MKQMTTTLFLIIALPFFIKAQNVKLETIKWNSLSTLDTIMGRETEEATTFITYGTKRMEWKNLNEGIWKRFHTILTYGEWPDVTQPGFVQYEVTDGTSSGTISIRKTLTETKISIDMDSEPPLSLVLTIGGLQILELEIAEPK